MITYLSNYILKNDSLKHFNSKSWNSELYDNFSDELNRLENQDSEFFITFKKFKQRAEYIFNNLCRHTLDIISNNPYNTSGVNQNRHNNVYNEIITYYTKFNTNVQDSSVFDKYNSLIPMFALPSFTRQGQNLIKNVNICNTYENHYSNLNGLEINDFKLINNAKTEKEFFEVVNKLSSEFKINPIYTKINEPDEWFTSTILNPTFAVNYLREFSVLNTPSALKELLKIRLEGLKFIAKTVLYIKHIYLKDTLVLKLEDSQADYTSPLPYSFNALLADITCYNHDQQFFINHSLTFSSYDGYQYQPLKDKDNNPIAKMLTKQYFAKAKEANYIKEVNNLKMFSMFPKEWLESFGTIPLVNKNINFQKALCNSVAYTKIKQQKDTLSVNTLDDVSFIGNFNVYISKDNNTEISDTLSDTTTINRLWDTSRAFAKELFKDKEVVDLTQLCSNSITFTNGKVNALVFNNFCTGLQPFTFEIKQVTKNQLLTSNNIFIPIAFKTTRYNFENLFNDLDLEEEIYYVSLVNFSDFNNVFRKFTKAQKFMQYFNNLLNTTNSIGLTNPQIYQEELARKFGKIVKYSNLQKDKFERLGDSFIERFATHSPNINSIINNERLSILNGKLNIDQSIIANLEKLKTTKELIKNKLDTETKHYDDLVKEKEKFQFQYQDLIETIERLRIKQLEYDQRLNVLPEEIQKQKSKLDQQIKLKNDFDINFNQANENYMLEEQKAVLSNDFVPDLFFQGLSNKGLFLIELTLNDKITNQTSIYTAKTINKLSKNEYDKNNIYSVEFIIAKPVEIKVDGDQNNIVYGGPYKVKVQNEYLQVAALNSSTIFAFINEESATLHPHSNNFRIYKNMDFQELWNYKRACLGEASPYIYNAFKENNLKMIIVNSLIWITSANSSDAWGRNYKYFPKKSDMNVDNLDSFAIETDTLINSIIEQKQKDEDDCDEGLAQQENINNNNEYIPFDHYHDDEEDDCDHDFSDTGVCEICGYECTHDGDVEDGQCMICGYQLWDLEDDYENNEEPQPTTNNVYVPYVSINTQTNNNN